MSSKHTHQKHEQQKHAFAVSNWPNPLHEDAFQGLAGEIMRLIEPETESDPAALLIPFLTVFGNIAGPKPYFQVEQTKHHANLFALVVGKTSRSRKGTAFDHVRELFKRTSTTWQECLVTGLTSGEGLKAKAAQVHDKRVFVYQPEFASVLQAQSRKGNTLSAALREAWDSGKMQILTKKDAITATGAHISIVGHITQDELRRELVRTDQANGYANRFLFVCAQRSKLLADGGHVNERKLSKLAKRLKQARRFASDVTELKRSTNAGKLWSKWYQELGDLSGIVGAIAARAEGQVLRLSVIYALLDQSQQIRTKHLKAALAVWRYCEASVRSIFGSTVGDKNADLIYEALRKAGGEGMYGTEIRKLFYNNLNREQTNQALQLLKDNRLVKVKSEKTGGRSANRWFALSV